MSEWILCKDRLPTCGDSVLVTDVFRNLWIGSYYCPDEDNYWEDDHGYVTQSNEVIAWMPLPEPYKENISVFTEERISKLQETINAVKHESNSEHVQIIAPQIYEAELQREFTCEDIICEYNNGFPLSNNIFIVPKERPTGTCLCCSMDLANGNITASSI